MEEKKSLIDVKDLEDLDSSDDEKGRSMNIINNMKKYTKNNNLKYNKEGMEALFSRLLTISNSKSKKEKKPEKSKKAKKITKAQDLSESELDPPKPSEFIKLNKDLLLLILSFSYPFDLPSFSAISHEFHNLINSTYTEVFFKRFCKQTWAHPTFKSRSHYFSTFGHNFRRMFMERPRLRYTGLYLAQTQYLRLGESETSLLRPMHVVKYWRYLRFYSDGFMLMLTSTNCPKKVFMKDQFKYGARNVLVGKFVMVEERVVAHCKVGQMWYEYVFKLPSSKSEAQVQGGEKASLSMVFMGWKDRLEALSRKLPIHGGKDVFKFQKMRSYEREFKMAQCKGLSYSFQDIYSFNPLQA